MTLAKEPSQRARRNAPTKMQVVQVQPVDQPSLPEIFGCEHNPITKKDWTTGALNLWSDLRDFASFGLLQNAQWSLLARGVALDDASLNGYPGMAKEARMHFAKFGITPADLAAMRIQFAQADQAEERRRTSRSAADARGVYKGLQAVDGR